LCPNRSKPTIRPSSLSFWIIFVTSAWDSADPWKQTSSREDDAGYANLDMASATILSLPGKYSTFKLNWDRVSPWVLNGYRHVLTPNARGNDGRS